MFFDMDKNLNCEIYIYKKKMFLRCKRQKLTTHFQNWKIHSSVSPFLHILYKTFTSLSDVALMIIKLYKLLLKYDLLLLVSALYCYAVLLYKKRKLQVFNFCNMCKNYLQSVNLNFLQIYIYRTFYFKIFTNARGERQDHTHLCRLVMSISFIKDVYTHGHYSTLKRVLTHKHDGNHLFSNILKILRRWLKKSLKIYTTSFVSAK